MSRPGRVAVIGLDCAAPQLVFHRWREQLPNLAALMERGLWGELRSCHPPITVPAWASMLSGKDPGQLGVYGFRDRRSYAYDDHAIASAQAITHDRVWDILSRAGKRVILLGVPLTYPPPQINGYVVSCFLTPTGTDRWTHPPSLSAEIDRVADGYVFDVDNFRTPDKSALLARIYAKTRKQFRVATHLITTKPWDFFMMVEMGPDRVHHGFWKYFDPAHPKHEANHPLENAIRDYYRYLDGAIGELVACIDSEAVVMIVSDHGAKKMHGGICINEWLIEQGYLKLQRYPDTPTPMHPGLVDWSATRAWGEGGYCGRLCLNVKGREPQGIVEPADYERLRTELIAAINRLAGPDGKSLGSYACRPEEVYQRTTGIAPDLIVYFGDLSWRSIGSVGGRSIYAGDNDTGPDDANHDWDGIFIARDARCEGSGVRLAGLQLMDVAPTILHHFGLPIPGDMRGRIIDESRADTLADSSAVRRRLEALGYI